ncbi:extracellular solute-binding protein [Neorhizobium sp. S3-V5DH]|uniref:ABC transporter substrate-binding protein n=1 Tax=Neorhizobium sp. S3-V5DH TaxID=2485166 RepID=UPI0010450E58|nr:extracellular solute-binding protein [Neorhizobium sp. S3-V5DH]TCV68659.1 carbohydrate ABC transporter substrate-binding protein (CUT1 family) [Neorhizobium sp. S3-V5DH]
MINLLGRRRFLEVAGIAALVASFDGATARAAATRLRLIYWGGQARAEKTGKASQLFSDRTGIAVQNEFLAWSDYWTKLATQIAGGNAPDIVQMDYRYIAEYASRQVILPLDEFIGQQLDLIGFDQDQIEGGKVGGKLYGISLGANSVANIVNTAVFEKAGITLPANGFTYAQLYEYAELFKQAKLPNGVRVISDASGHEQMLESWLRQRGKALYTADGQLGFDVDDAKEWFILWSKLREAGVCVTAEDNALATGQMESSMIVMGKAALQPDNSNLLIAYQALMQDRLALAPYPLISVDATGGQYRKPSMFFSIARSSRAKSEAAQLLSFFISDPEAAKVLGTERGIPCSEKVRTALVTTLTPLERAGLEYVSGLGKILGPIPPSPPTAAGEIYQSALTNISQQVAFGMEKPENAGEMFVQQATELLSRG